MTTDAHRIKLLKELLAERILVLDGAFGTFVLGENLSAADYGGARYEGCNENVVRTRPDLIRRMHAGFLEVGADIIETASFQASPIVLAEYASRARHARAQSSRRDARARASGQVQHRRQAALRRRLDGPDDQEHLGHRRRHVRSNARRLPGAGRRLDRRRRRHPAARNRQRHAQLQGRPRRNRERDRETRRRARGLRVGHHRNDGHAAQRPGHRGLLHLARASRPALDGPQLRDRSRLHDRSPAHALRHLEILRRVRAQCRPARRRRPLQRNARDARRENRALRRKRMGQPGRRMLRHHARAHSPAGRCGRGQASATALDRQALGRLRHRDSRHRQRHAARDRRRADQRARQPQVQAADRRGQGRGSFRSRPRAGAPRRAHPRRMPAGSRIATRWPTSRAFSKSRSRK